MASTQTVAVGRRREIGLGISYLSSRSDLVRLEAAVEADRLGFSSVWAAEAYGSDVVSVLGNLAARTERIHLGAGVMQIPARTPAMTAMTAATLDVLSDGRFRLGLGVSGPQVAEGWHGSPWRAPLGRTREYIGAVRQALSREPLQVDGSHYRIPLSPDVKPLKLAIHPVSQVPVYIAAIGPANVQLAIEIADGWLAVFGTSEYFARALAGVRPDFDVVANLPYVPGTDLEHCADQVRAYTALYVGGMGSRSKNFYNKLVSEFGFEKEAALIQDLFLDGKRKEAEAAVPFELIDRTSLLGPPERIADRMTEYFEGGVTTVNMLGVDTASDKLGLVRGFAQAFDLVGSTS